MPVATKTGELQALVDSVPLWWHSIDIGHGVVTPGHETPERLANRLASLRLPPLEGRSVLDIGAWDGFYSFQAEKLGAASVVALDHYVWSIDLAAARSTPVKCKPEHLPGKRGFDIAHEALGSRVEAVVADFMETDLVELGQFDVVLFLGVLYHMRHPLLALERLAQLTRELAVIESEAVLVPGHEDLALCEFFEKDECCGDPTNWWAPNAKALVDMCRAAGFARVEVLTSVKPRRTRKARLRHVLRSRTPSEVRFRLVVHALK